MSVRIEGGAIFLEGRCMVEDAETLLVAILENPQMPIDLVGLLRLHMAVAQVLLATKPPTRGDAPDIFLSRNVFGR